MPNFNAFILLPPQDFLKALVWQILTLPRIEAVCYDVTHKPPGTVEWE